MFIIGIDKCTRERQSYLELGNRSATWRCDRRVTEKSVIQTSNKTLWSCAVVCETLVTRSDVKVSYSGKQLTGAPYSVTRRRHLPSLRFANNRPRVTPMMLKCNSISGCT